MFRRICHGDEGFTLSELMVVTTLLGVILAAAYMLMYTASSIADSLEAQTVAAEEGRAVLDQVSRELRQAYEAEEGKAAFITAQPREVCFYTDVGRDGYPDKVRYRVINDKIYRSQATAGTIMPPFVFSSFSADTPVQGVVESSWTGSLFTYYDHPDAGNAAKVTAQLNEISAVKIRLINKVTRGRKTASVDVTTWVKVRAIHNTID